MPRAKCLFILLLCGAALRLLGISYGLPAVFNADEPHAVNVAVSFGAGTLNPGYFKYPTLYMYVLFAAYGVFYLFWSGAGFLHSVGQFAELFVWHPAPFYLIARGLSAAFSLAALYPAYLAAALLAPGSGDSSGSRAGIWPAAFLAASPVVVVSAHAAKPESLMLLLASWAWFFAARHRVAGKAGDLLKSGFLAGLACSAQYTAVPVLALIPIAWLAGPSSGIGALVLASVAAGAGFLFGCPFALLDYPAFLAALRDMRAMQGMVGGWNAQRAGQVAWNVLTFAGPAWSGGPGLAAGAFYLLRKDRKSAVLLLAPVFILAVCLSLSGEGGWQRYLFVGFPALALTAGLGMEWAARTRGRLAWPALLLALSGALESWSFDRELLLPDTRTLAARWIESHVPQGSKILMDQEHASPPLRLSLEGVDRLLERTKALGHPRARYYEAMKAGHPGGGYDAYQALRSAADLHTLPGHAAESAMGRQVLDVSGGVSAVRRAGVRWVVLTSFGAEPERSPELGLFFRQIQARGKPLAEFRPQYGLRTGPRIRIYDMEEARGR